MVAHGFQLTTPTHPATASDLLAAACAQQAAARSAEVRLLELVVARVAAHPPRDAADEAGTRVDG